MPDRSKPLVISAPEPRSIDLIFTDEAKRKLYDRYELIETSADTVVELPERALARARYILGQPPLDQRTVDLMRELRAVLNVESNLINNMPYDTLFQRGIHVLTTGVVFAEPVAEIGLAMALNLARNVVEADVAFSQGKELWGADGNHNARLLTGSTIGVIGFGDLGKALVRLLAGFRADILVHDPWLPGSVIYAAGADATDLDTLLTASDTIFVVAAVTTQNQKFLDAHAFAKMKAGTSFILLSRADIVDFDALMDAVQTGHIRAASDVFPEEPLPANHRVRKLSGFLRSAHRAGALDIAFKRMGDMVLDDMALLDRGLPPVRCKRAERETFALMQSRPVTRN